MGYGFESMLKVVKLGQFDGYGAEVSMDFIWQELKLIENNYVVQLFETDKIVKLDIPFSEVYHRCSDEEWKQVIEYAKRFSNQ